MVDVAQLVRASDCGSEGRGFEPHRPPKIHGVRIGYWLAKPVCETGVPKGTCEFNSRLAPTFSKQICVMSCKTYGLDKHETWLGIKWFEPIFESMKKQFDML